jgi:hypothetical protein
LHVSELQVKRIGEVGDNGHESEYERFHSVLSLLSYLLKAPMVPPGTPVVNALAAQRQALVNVFRACVGLPVEDFMLLEHKVHRGGIMLNMLSVMICIANVDTFNDC